MNPTHSRITLTLGLALSLLFCGSLTTARAQQAPPPPIASGPSDDVPANHWAYFALKTLYDAGFEVNFFRAAYAGRRPLTRAEFATRIAAILASVPQVDPAPVPKPDHFTAAQQAVFRAFEQHPPALNALAALEDEFAPQLASAGVNTQEVFSRVGELQFQIRQELRAKKIAVAPQEARDPFADVPFDAPAWQQAKTLMLDGIVVGIPLDGTYGGRIPMTRFQFGLSLTRLLFLLPGVAEHPETTPTASASFSTALSNCLLADPPAISALQMLVTEFQPELKINTCHIQASPVKAYLTRLARLAPTLPSNQTLPPDHWTYHALRMLRQAGAYVTVAPSMTRNDMARSLADSLCSLLPLNEPSDGRDKDFGDMENTRALQDHPAALAALIQLSQEFTPELQLPLWQRARSVSQMKVCLLALQQPFPDVPKNHWAYQSVETLRKLGIVRGEADGKFHG